MTAHSRGGPWQGFPSHEGGATTPPNAERPDAALAGSGRAGRATDDASAGGSPCPDAPTNLVSAVPGAKGPRVAQSRRRPFAYGRVSRGVLTIGLVRGAGV